MTPYHLKSLLLRRPQRYAVSVGDPDRLETSIDKNKLSLSFPRTELRNSLDYGISASILSHIGFFSFSLDPRRSLRIAGDDVL